MKPLRDKILNADDLDKRIVEVPEWGVTVEVRSPTGENRGRIANLVQTDPPDYALLYPALLIPTLFDPETGEQLFTWDDAEALNKKNGKALENVAMVALELAALSNDDIEAAKKD